MAYFGSLALFPGDDVLCEREIREQTTVTSLWLSRRRDSKPLVALLALLLRHERTGFTNAQRRSNSAC